jgi:hypothetical protein
VRMVKLLSLVTLRVLPEARLKVPVPSIIDPSEGRNSCPD